MAGSRAPLAFISYAHVDESYRDQLRPWFKPLERDGLFKWWDDRAVDVGSNWKAEILAKLEEADIVILLISQDFLASDFCHDIEMMRAIQKVESGKGHVVPIIIRTCDWQRTDISKYQAVPKNAKPIATYSDRDSAYQEIVDAFRRLLDRHYKATGAKASAAKPKPTPSRQRVKNDPTPTQPSSGNNAVIKGRPARQRRLGARQSDDTLLERLLPEPQKATDFEKRRFIDRVFKTAKAKFQQIAREFRKKPTYDMEVRVIDAERFQAVLYENGKQKAACTIYVSHDHGDEIRYCGGLTSATNSWNDSLGIEMTYTKPLKVFSYNNVMDRSKMTAEEGAEYLLKCFLGTA